MNRQKTERQIRQQRERYAFVKEFYPREYTDICAFSSTIDLTNKSAAAEIEDFCMSIVRRVDGRAM